VIEIVKANCIMMRDITAVLAELTLASLHKQHTAHRCLVLLVHVAANIYTAERKQESGRARCGKH
jgi:hypothetical protein